MTHPSQHLPATCRRPTRRSLALVALPSAFALLTAAAPALAADGKPSPGRALSERQGCQGCHAIETQLVGPAFRAVAERYRDQAAAEAELVQRIRAGGGGRWGSMAMPPQAQLSEADARRLAKWILSGAK